MQIILNSLDNENGFLNRGYLNVIIYQTNFLVNESLHSEITAKITVESLHVHKANKCVKVCIQPCCKHIRRG